jgi:hypothetical protein
MAQLRPADIINGGGGVDALVSILSGGQQARPIYRRPTQLTTHSLLQTYFRPRASFPDQPIEAQPTAKPEGKRHFSSRGTLQGTMGQNLSLDHLK